MSAAQRWEAALAAWAWPEDIRAAAPADPWRLDPDQLASHDGNASDRATPADVAARQLLPRRGSVLDVGCGTGASSAPLRTAAGSVTGVDPRPEMRERFAAAIGGASGLPASPAGGGPEVRTIDGRWPAVADVVPATDVVIAHNVLYDVTSGVDEFVAALHDHAREGVVLALTARHPLHWVNPYAEAVHGIRRPAEPTAGVAADVVREVTGATPTYLTWTEHVERARDDDAMLQLVARRACVRPEQLDDLRAVLARVPVPTTREMVALVWDGGG